MNKKKRTQANEVFDKNKWTTIRSKNRKNIVCMK